ncbi:nuclease-related domain-containing protein [Salibacterium sp. K-3]
MMFRDIFQKKKKDARRAMIKEIEDELRQLPHPIQYVRDVPVHSASGAAAIDYIILSPCGIFVVNQRTETGHIQADMEQKTWYVNDTVAIANPFCRLNEWRETIQTRIPPQYHEYFISIVSFLAPSTFETAPVWRKSSSSRILMHHKELSEYIQRKMFITRFQHQRPLLGEETILTLYDTLASTPAEQR